MNLFTMGIVGKEFLGEVRPPPHQTATKERERERERERESTEENSDEKQERKSFAKNIPESMLFFYRQISTRLLDKHCLLHFN